MLSSFTRTCMYVMGCKASSIHARWLPQLQASRLLNRRKRWRRAKRKNLPRKRRRPSGVPPKQSRVKRRACRPSERERKKRPQNQKGLQRKKRPLRKRRPRRSSPSLRRPRKKRIACFEARNSRRSPSDFAALQVTLCKSCAAHAACRTSRGGSIARS